MVISKKTTSLYLYFSIIITGIIIDEKYRTNYEIDFTFEKKKLIIFQLFILFIFFKVDSCNLNFLNFTFLL